MSNFCQNPYHRKCKRRGVGDQNFFYHFWPKNDGEKWSRKNIFEIPSCASHFLLINFILHRKEDFSTKLQFQEQKWPSLRIVEFQYLRQMGGKIQRFTTSCRIFTIILRTLQFTLMFILKKAPQKSV